MKTSQINECYGILTKMENKKVPVSLGLILLQNKKKLDPVVENISVKEREIVDLYAEKDEAGNVIYNDQNQFKIPKDNISQFNKEIDELVNTEIEIVFDKVSMDILNRCDESGFDSLSLEELRIIQEYMT